jgi:hypothetical protein
MVRRGFAGAAGLRAAFATALRGEAALRALFADALRAVFAVGREVDFRGADFTRVRAALLTAIYVCLSPRIAQIRRFCRRHGISGPK